MGDTAATADEPVQQVAEQDMEGPATAAGETVKVQAEPVDAEEPATKTRTDTVARPQIKQELEMRNKTVVGCFHIDLDAPRRQI